MIDIQEWLAELGLERYAPVFAQHEITVEVLPHLTEPDIDRLALPTGPRRRLMVAIQELAGETRARISAGSRVNRPDGAPGAERRQLTVMFCDLVGSTALSQQLDPEELRQLMQAYRKVSGDAVARYQGHVAQYLGDGLMVYFGWPSAHEDDAERSVRAALEIVQAVKEVPAEPPLAVRIGAATGTVVVGEDSLGENAESKLALGETPNLAARLQGLAGPNEIVIAPATRRLVGAAFELSDLGAHALKGIAQPVRAWRVHALHRSQGRFEAAHEGIGLTPLVGRQEEVALLLRRWEQAREGEGQVVLVGGEPGIGKSRLTQVLRERAAGAAHSFLHYQCSPYHLNSPLFPIIEQLELTAGFTREDTPEQKLDKMEAMLVGSPEERAEAAPLIATLLSLPVDRYPPLALSPQKRKEKMFEALAAQLEALCQRQPVLVVFEDVHWIDPTSQEALDALVPRLQTRPLMLVITYRPEYAPHWTDQPHVAVLGLSRLSRRYGTDLVAEVARGRPLPTDVLAQIVMQTDGVPLFMEEVTKSVLESALLREARDMQSAPPAPNIPTSLRDSLLARLDRHAPMKRILQIGACIGREFSYELLARLSSLPDESLEDALRKLTGTGLVYRRGTPPTATYTFKHALVQDAAYDSLLKSKRQELHARLAQILEKDFADRVAAEPGLLAHHYTHAGDLVTAVPWWCRAGESAMRRLALQEAIGHFRRGLALIEQLPPSPEREDLELSLREPMNGAWIAWRGWPAPEVGTNAAAILELSQRRGAPGSTLAGLYGLWINTLTQGRIAHAVEWADRLLAEGERRGDLDFLVLGHTAVMISHFYLGDLITARRHGELGLALYDPQRADRWLQLTGHDAGTVFIGWSAHWSWMLGYPDRAVELSDEEDAHARRLGHGLDLGYALTVGAYVFDYRREPERLLGCVREADRVGREQSIPILYEVMVPQVEGLAQLRSGKLSEAISSLRCGLEAWNRMGGHSRVPYLKSALAEAVALQGDLSGGLTLIEECLEQIERPGWHERSHLAEALRLKGWMLMQQGHGAEAEAALRASIDWARRQQAKSWELRSARTLAELHIQRGRPDQARELLAPIYEWFTEGFDTHDLKASRKLLDGLREGPGAVPPQRRTARRSARPSR